MTIRTHRDDAHDAPGTAELAASSWSDSDSATETTNRPDADLAAAPQPELESDPVSPDTLADHDADPLCLALVWHMHQPWYRAAQDGDYELPWVYLHATKDYADMVALLEAHSGMRCVVNFAPVLIEQIDDYARQFAEFRATGSAFRDPVLRWLFQPGSLPQDAAGRADVVATCARAFAPRMIEPWPAFRQRLDFARHVAAERPADLLYLDDAFLRDLLLRYHLVWTGASVRRTHGLNPLLECTTLLDDGAREQLLAAMSTTLAELLPRYRAAADRGQIELSMTPHSHPIVPLLLGFDAMRCAQPQAPAPNCPDYPDGESRARWHFDAGLAVFEQHFGRRPSGCWLSEGAVSDAAVRLAGEYGFAWVASGESVWRHSRTLHALPCDGEHRETLFRPHALPDCPTRVFFRDDGLSDRIGFEYKDWAPEDAARDFIGHLDNIARHHPKKPDGDPRPPLVSVILDGENAWEYYPNNGWDFLDSFYRQLVLQPNLHLATLTEAASRRTPEPLPGLCAGSWVYGTLSTWIGEPAKNRAWALLVAAKQAVDSALASGNPIESRAWIERQLAVCEGSDWFWWFNDEQVAEGAHSFDSLFRSQLGLLYAGIGMTPPETLDVAILAPAASGHAHTEENAGTMRRGQA